MIMMNNRKFISSILVLFMLSGFILTGFTQQQGIGNVYYETEADIYNNTTYHEQLGEHGSNGIQRAYFVKANTDGTGLKPYVFEGEVTGRYTLDTMVNMVESQGYKVVAGINGDIYCTTTGTPNGLSIHDHKIKTSGSDPKYVISFTKEGKASLEKANLGFSVTGMINAPSRVIKPIFDPTDPDITRPEDIELEEQVIHTPTAYKASIGYFNVPYGGSRSLHLFNRQYASSTKTSDDSTEVILDAGSVENAQPTVGGTIKATVVKVKNSGRGTGNTKMADHQLVLSAAKNSAYAAQLGQLIPGSEVEISVQDKSGGNLMLAKEAIGVYYVLYHDNQFVSKGTNLNPRTIIGIKPDGTLILYALDGRQPGFSTGLGLTDATKHLVDLGCSTVVNMDGGGSSMINVRKGGIDQKAMMKNRPSGKVQRKVTNGLLLVYDTPGMTNQAHLHTYPSQPLVMPGADIQLKTYATNDQFEPVTLGGSVSYSVDSGTDNQVSENGLFTAGTTTGPAVIEARSGDISTRVKVNIQNKIKFTTSVKNLNLDPGASADINITAKHGLVPIASKDSLYTWTCDPSIGKIDAEGLFQAINEGGNQGNIYVEYNGQKQTIPVQVGPVSTDFSDTLSHWAQEPIAKLAAKGIVNGVGNNIFLPNEALTRAEFLTMLANTISGLDLTQTPPTEFTDISSADWYYNSVNWGFAAGIVNGLDAKTFAPKDKITREQMATMLNNFTNNTELILPEISEEVSFADAELISSWAADSVNKIVFAGIMQGYPEGVYKPQGSATRAEAAKVVYQLITIRDSVALK